jgi:transposase-like protein
VNCPKCNSDNVVGYGYISDRANINLRTNEIEHIYGFQEIDLSSIDEFNCKDCKCEWEGEYEWEL